MNIYWKGFICTMIVNYKKSGQALKKRSVQEEPVEKRC